MTKMRRIGITKVFLKASGIVIAVSLSLLYAGVGSALSGQNLDLGDPIPGHCAYEDPGFWVTEDGGCKDVATGVVYSWWSGDTVFAGTQAEMIDWCENLKEAGYEDWHLPSKDVMLSSAAHGAYVHLNFNTDPLFMSSSTQGKKFPYLISLPTVSSIAVGQGSTARAFCARNLPTKKPKK